MITPNLITIEMDDNKKKKIVLENFIKMLTNRNILDKTKLEQNIADFIAQQNDDNVYQLKKQNICMLYYNKKISNLNKNSEIGLFLQKYADKTKFAIVAFAQNKVISQINNVFKTEIFSINELLINIVDHIIVPQHILLSEEETQVVLDEYNARKRDMPKILKSDPIVRYYNMPVGRICKIIRPSDTSGESVYYRLVI
jgi:DNA-directed RNA polymerase subunit H (RpoH/RPB5)